MAKSRTGVWFIGARGGVASTATVGLVALKEGWTGPTALVSQLPRFAGLDLAPWDSFVLGGHEIRQGSLFDEAMRMHTESRAIDPELIRRCKPELEQIEKRQRPGVLFGAGRTIEGLATPGFCPASEPPRAAIERVQQDLAEFKSANRLDHVIMVNVSSTEPAVSMEGLPSRWSELAPLLDRADKCPLRASSLYAIAALELGCSYINFTPSAGSTPPAIRELAMERATRHVGYDGKTGETLMKSVLAPMFGQRNLEVMSWVGHNIFGNMDGKVLDDPINKAAKVTSKDRILHDILGYAPQTLVTIEYIQSLGDWKTAWDHIHFRGFLGTPMVLQFTWQGCDSLLAAPLVLDLIRFTERSYRAGNTGILTHLCSFFKSPLGVTENDFTRQFQMLESWANGLVGAA